MLSLCLIGRMVREKVVLWKPEGLAEMCEGTNVEVGLDVVHSVGEDG